MLIFKFARSDTIGEIPQEDPITNTISDVPSFVNSSIFCANSSEENILPFISIVIT